MGYHSRRLLKDLIPEKPKSSTMFSLLLLLPGLLTAATLTKHLKAPSPIYTPPVLAMDMVTTLPTTRALPTAAMRPRSSQAMSSQDTLPILKDITPSTTQFTRSATQLASTQAATSTTSTTPVLGNSCPTTPPSTSTRVTLASDSRLPTNQSEFKGILKP